MEKAAEILEYKGKDARPPRASAWPVICCFALGIWLSVAAQSLVFCLSGATRMTLPQLAIYVTQFAGITIIPLTSIFAATLWWWRRRIARPRLARFPRSVNLGIVNGLIPLMMIIPNDEKSAVTVIFWMVLFMFVAPLFSGWLCVSSMPDVMVKREETELEIGERFRI